MSNIVDIKIYHEHMNVQLNKKEVRLYRGLRLKIIRLTT